MYVFRQKANVNGIIDEAEKRAEYTPTIFKIYDKSTNEICNRLIVVAPFDWYIWACRGELYILNPEGGIKCAANTTPAVQVLADQFLETCLKLNLNSILDVYVNGKIPYVVQYEITTTTFTILSALNILMKNYITFDVEKSAIDIDTISAMSRSVVVTNKQISSNIRHLTDADILAENFISETDTDSNAILNMSRVLSKSDVVAITTIRGSRNMSELYKNYYKHTSNLKPKINEQYKYKVEDLDISHDKYITLRQHATDATNYNPKMKTKPISNIENS